MNVAQGQAMASWADLKHMSRSWSRAWAISMLDIMSKGALIHFWPETWSKQRTA